MRDHTPASASLFLAPVTPQTTAPHSTHTSKSGYALGNHSTEAPRVNTHGVWARTGPDARCRHTVPSTRARHQSTHTRAARARTRQTTRLLSTIELLAPHRTAHTHVHRPLFPQQRGRSVLESAVKVFRARSSAVTSRRSSTASPPAWRHRPTAPPAHPPSCAPFRRPCSSWRP